MVLCVGDSMDTREGDYSTHPARIVPMRGFGLRRVNETLVYGDPQDGTFIAFQVKGSWDVEGCVG